MNWKKAIVVLAGIAAVPASFLAGAMILDFVDRHFLSKGRMWTAEAESLGELLCIGALALVFLVPAAVVWLRIYRAVSNGAQDGHWLTQPPTRHRLTDDN